MKRRSHTRQETASKRPCVFIDLVDDEDEDDDNVRKRNLLTEKEFMLLVQDFIQDNNSDVTFHLNSILAATTSDNANICPSLIFSLIDHCAQRQIRNPKLIHNVATRFLRMHFFLKK